MGASREGVGTYVWAESGCVQGGSGCVRGGSGCVWRGSGCVQGGSEYVWVESGCARGGNGYIWGGSVVNVFMELLLLDKAALDSQVKDLTGKQKKMDANLEKEVMLKKEVCHLLVCVFVLFVCVCLCCLCVCVCVFVCKCVSVCVCVHLSVHGCAYACVPSPLSLPSASGNSEAGTGSVQSNTTHSKGSKGEKSRCREEGEGD